MYLIDGQLHDIYNLDQALQDLQQALPQHLARPLESSTVIKAVAGFAQRLRDAHTDLPLDSEHRQALIDFCQPQALVDKRQRELGADADSLRRIDYRQPRFEAWRPLGLVVHITPANAPLLAFCAVVESLLAGNVNWLRPSSSDQGLTARLLRALVDCDASAQLAGYVAVIPASTEQIGQLCKPANGVAAWGGEAALQAIRQQLAPGCRWIDWGHRISFVYLCAETATPQALDAVADEVCRLDQQACSSPQWLLVDSDDPQVLRDIGERLAQALQRRGAQWPALLPTRQEAAQIITHTQMARLGQSFAGHTGQVWNGPGWRVIWTHDRQLAPSPLFRSVLLHPVPQALLSATLLPWRNVLQSCALLCAQPRIAELAHALIAAGVTRIAPIGSIHDGYAGEPHDGVYALQRLSRRVSVSLAATQLPNQASLDSAPSPAKPCAAIMDKQAFVTQPINDQAQLYFRSGGSSGTPALAGYSYRDFERQMRATADGLFAAGVDPARDRVMNLFFCGGLYGGFLSFSKALELLEVTHLPMAAPTDDDYREIAQLIIDQRVNVLVGMPGTLHRLFLNEQERLRAYAGVEKVFLGGEHLSEQNRVLLRSCGVATIRSAIYGSVDAGPLGHACQVSADGVFHLMSDIQQLEIVAFEEDVPVVGDQVGRLLVTSLAREGGQRVQRYEIGDSGRWLPGVCACGLTSPRFELLQRHGKLLRIGTDFISLSELATRLKVPFQLHLDHSAEGVERLQLRCELAADIAKTRLADYLTLMTVIDSGLLVLQIEQCSPEHFIQNRHSGKTPLVIDSRR
ncbi:aldehyde dehydrogenase family protein [Pseudomonas moraviensis subsp. stanleyae]|uniref:aldehyde dehydrogenase family protein n=1 Tax=Pseudomonas moraviensis TaxID=321662 RepID=UPI002E37E2CC|nr:aldehyde dehydrogenase family protein [Pseudomonas moraviensis]MED7666351.1 aldehyde dehydrogenase family protein [Pseudomonas moraviensis subsp. stanleyae]